MKTCVLMLLCGLSAAGWAGQLNPPAGPTVGTMKTLEEVEPRTAIRQADIPLTISASGSYYLAENVTAGSHGVIINADQVTLDLNGFTLSGSGNGYGISMNWQKNIEIRNGTVTGFQCGIYESNSAGQNYTISNVRVTVCRLFGINLAYCDNCLVEKCTVSDSGTVPSGSGYIYGINVGDNSIVSENKVYALGAGITTPASIYGIVTGSGCRISGNMVAEVGDTATADYVMGIFAKTSCMVNDNTCRRIGQNATANVIAFFASDGCRIINNTAHENGKSASTAAGFNCSSTCLISGNTAYSNGELATSHAYGIFGSTGCTIVNNTVYNTGSSAAAAHGIRAGSGSTVTGNTSHGNGKLATGSVVGLYISSYCLVNNNTAYNNNGTNMNIVASSVYGTNVAP